MSGKAYCGCPLIMFSFPKNPHQIFWKPSPKTFGTAVCSNSHGAFHFPCLCRDLPGAGICRKNFSNHRQRIGNLPRAVENFTRLIGPTTVLKTWLARGNEPTVVKKTQTLTRLMPLLESIPFHEAILPSKSRRLAAEEFDLRFDYAEIRGDFTH